jgi:antitoxin (DNA-binding transcriptional repressor) of toxin-antitoxin stability system
MFVCDTLCHMKTISIRDLHEKTGAWVRQSVHYGEIAVTDHGKTVARIIPQIHEQEVPYFARRKLTPAFMKMLKSGKLRGGTDSTIIISEDRDRIIK